jgi:hypothetical protein
MIVRNWKGHGRKRRGLNEGTTRHLTGGIQENHEKNFVKMMVSQPRLDSGTSRLQARGAVA